MLSISSTAWKIISFEKLFADNNPILSQAVVARIAWLSRIPASMFFTETHMLEASRTPDKPKHACLGFPEIK
jgi:hypothetical protein